MPIEANNSTTITVDGVTYAYFGGTNYLGLAHRPELMQAAQKAFQLYGFSAGASRLTSGENDLLLQLEETLSEFARSEAALVLAAGYMSNFAVVDALDSVVDLWIAHKQAHGSVKSALRGSKKRVIIDDGIEQRTLREKYNLPEGVTIGVFSEPIEPMTGALTNAQKLINSVQKHDYVILDEAHSFGVLGDSGIGALEYFKLSRFEHLIRTGTFSKAIGTQGGFVLGSEELIDRAKQHSNCYKVSTPPSPLACAATVEALRLLRTDRAATVGKLHSNIDHVNKSLVALGLSDYKDNTVPIYYLRDNPLLAKTREALKHKGIFLPAVTSYFADFCDIGLRWTIQAAHSTENLDQLTGVIAESLQTHV